MGTSGDLTSLSSEGANCFLLVYLPIGSLVSVLLVWTLKSLAHFSAEWSYPSISWVLLQAAVDIYSNPSQLEYKMFN